MCGPRKKQLCGSFLDTVPCVTIIMFLISNGKQKKAKKSRIRLQSTTTMALSIVIVEHRRVLEVRYAFPRTPSGTAYAEPESGDGWRRRVITSIHIGQVKVVTKLWVKLIKSAASFSASVNNLTLVRPGLMLLYDLLTTLVIMLFGSRSIILNRRKKGR